MTDKQEFNIEKLIDIADWEIEKPQFAQLYNFVLQNLIDPTALTIWCYLQSKPSNWRPRKKEIENHFPTIGRDKAHKAFMTLKECGLYEAFSFKNKESGLVDGWKIRIKCGIGCEQLILKWKEKFLELHVNKKKKKQKNHTTENQECGENHTTENQYSGSESTIEAGRGLIQNTDYPDSGESVVIEKKETSLEKKDLTTTTNKTNPVVVVVLNSQKITTQLLTAFRDNPVETDKIKTEEEFLSACEYSILHRNDGNTGDPIEEMGRVRGIIKLVKLGAFENPKGWTNKPKASQEQINERMRLQEEASIKKWNEEEKVREIERKRKMETPVTIDLVEQKGVKRLGGVLAGLPMLQ